jgi:hypothetical protein
VLRHRCGLRRDEGLSVASLEIRAGDFERGVLPAVCPKHGATTMDTSQRRFYTRTPAWLIALIVISLALALIVALAIRSGLSGRLPRCEQCLRAKRRTVTVLAALWLALIVGFWPITVAGGAVAAVWFVLLVLVVIGSITASGHWSVSGWLTKDKSLIHLRNVHPEFVNAVTVPASSIK